MARTQERDLGDIHLQLCLRNFWRKPRGQEGGRLYLIFKVISVSSFTLLTILPTILPKWEKAMLMSSALVESH